MTLADVASDHVQFWWISLGLGLVVISAVVLLLGFLTIMVKDIDDAVTEVGDEAGALATQTATTWMLNETVDAAGALRDELALHAQAMSAAARG